MLLHGGGRSSGDWDGAAVRLRALGRRPVALDLRGHGSTATADWSWDLALSDIAAVVDALGLIRPAVVGHSLGGMIAALWAAAHPDCPLAANLDGHGNPTRGTRPMLNYLGNNTHQQCSTTTEAAGSSANDHLSAERTTGL
jgi:pimeloyl-ACP methyl ester carboxylesterase